MAAEFSLPKQWEDWANWVLGIWLCLSPWVLDFSLEPALMQNAVVVGSLLILTEVVTLSLFRPWEEWISVALGGWLVASSWVLAAAHPAAMADFAIVGALVVGLALYEMRTARQG